MPELHSALLTSAHAAYRERSMDRRSLIIGYLLVAAGSALFTFALP